MTSNRRDAAYAAAAGLIRADATKRAALLVMMGDRLAEGPAPVPLRDLLADLRHAGVPGFEYDGPPKIPPGRNRRDHPAYKAMVRHADALLERLIRDGYLTRARWQRKAKGGIPEAYVWDLGPRVTGGAS